MMKIAVVGECEPALGSHSPLFQIFTYEGPTSVATTYELSDCSVEDALEAAEMLSRKNELLWSLALVTRPPQNGLTWISGTNYHERPETPDAWRLRGQMQARYLSENSMRNEALLLPNGLKLIRMFPEWGVDFPLWDQYPDTHPYEPGSLPISKSLEQELVLWSREWASYGEGSERPETWKTRGWGLFERLQKALHGFAEVQPRFDD